MFRERIRHSRARLLIRALTACSIALITGGCISEPPVTPPNFVLVTFDTTRADHCSVNGYGRDTTPNLAAIAARGMRVEVAYAPTSSTGPSHATLFTALDPRRHGVIKNGVPLADGYETLSERLHEAGYQTAAFVSSFVLHEKFGLSQGFDVYDDGFTPKEAKIKRDFWEGHTITEGFDRRAEFTADRTIDWIRNVRDVRQPFFLFVHFFDPHAPYGAPSPYNTRFAPDPGDEQAVHLAAYEGEVAYADAHLGRLVDALNEAGIVDNTLMVVTADHGEGLGEHGDMEHGVNIYEESVRVPFIAAWPGNLPNATTIHGPVSLADVAPTVLTLLEGASLPLVDGEDLSEAWLGKRDIDSERVVPLFRRHYDPRIVRETPVSGRLHGVRSGDWKLVIGEAEERFELYNLAEDPRELNNVAGKYPEKARELAETIATERARIGASSAPLPEIDADDAERLRALGYVD